MLNLLISKLASNLTYNFHPFGLTQTYLQPQVTLACQFETSTLHTMDTAD